MRRSSGCCPNRNQAKLASDDVGRRTAADVLGSTFRLFRINYLSGTGNGEVGNKRASPHLEKELRVIIMGLEYPAICHSPG